MRSPQELVGRMVRLKTQVFERVTRRSRASDDALENFFLVAAFDAGMHRLVCYGADCRVSISPDDVMQFV